MSEQILVNEVTALTVNEVTTLAVNPMERPKIAEVSQL